MSAFAKFRFEPLKIHHSDEAVVVEARMTETHRAAWAGIEPSGGTMDIRLACVFDVAAVQRQLGAAS